MSISTLVHVADVGDVTFKDAYAGTRGRAKHIEGFQIEAPVALRYMAHVRNVGDLSWVRAGQYCGTRGRALPIEGFAIEVVGEDAKKWTVRYMAHLANQGDTPVVADGEFCGTKGQARSVEGIQVWLTPRTVPVPPVPVPPVPVPPVPPNPEPLPPPAREFRPALIPLSAGEIPNSYRGQYEWIIQRDLKPPDWSWLDSYDRLGWWQLEPREGVYDFADIEARLELAAQRRGRHSLGIMTALSYDYRSTIPHKGEWVPSFHGGVQVPDYLRSRISGWQRGGSWFPDWNDPYYLARWEALLRALGNAYRDDPRFGYIDIRGYGDFGEWHLAGLDDVVGGVTTDNAIRLVNATVDAFRGTDGRLRKFCLMMIAHDAALRHAVALDPLVGVRADGFGSPLGPSVGYAEPASHPARQKWTTAPYVAEWFGNADNLDQQYTDGLRHVDEYHLAMVSGGNIVADPNVGSYWAYEALLKRSGYRFELRRVGISAAGIESEWANVGVTPAYDPWKVVWELRGAAGVRRVESSLDLRKALPGGRTVSDRFVIQPGTYELSVRVEDASGYLEPLRLATEGRQADGRYVVGRVLL